jgi:hypothetical protein
LFVGAVAFDRTIKSMEYVVMVRTNPAPTPDWRRLMHGFDRTLRQGLCSQILEQERLMVLMEQMGIKS